MKAKVLFSLLFIFICTMSAFSMGQTPGGNQGNGSHHGGGGTPEPATILLILGGAGAAFALKKFKDR